MNTTYKPTLSPLQPKVKPVTNIKTERHPIYEEIKKLCSDTNYSIDVSFEEDMEALNSFSISGLVAVKCTMKTHDQIIAFGRSCSVLSQKNRYVDRVLSGLIGGSFLSAANNAMKVLENLRMSQVEEININNLNKNNMNTQTAVASFEGPRRGYYFGEDSTEEPEMTDKQRDYLNRLVAEVDDEDEREQYFSQINSGLSKQDASDLIASLVPVR